MFKIDEFISSINKGGVIKTNRFVVFFTLPEYLRGRETDYGYQDKLISLRCESAQFPGIAFGSIDGPPRLGYGAVESIPYNVAFEDISLTFLVDAHTRIHKLFYDWVNTIVNFQGSKGQSDWKRETNPFTKAAAYEVGYKDKYRTDILVTVYDTDDKQIMTVKVYNAFPKLLPSTDLAWGSNDELMKMTIPFSFTDFDVTYHRVEESFAAAVNLPQPSVNIPRAQPVPKATTPAKSAPIQYRASRDTYGATASPNGGITTFRGGGGSFGGGGGEGSF